MSGQPPIPDYRKLGYHHSARLQPLRHRLAYLVVRGLLVLVALLPVRALQALGRGFGSVFYAFSGKFRELCETQLGMAMPELSAAERRRIGRECLRQQGMTLMETLALPRLRRDAERWVSSEGQEALVEAAGEGKGVLLVTAHTGNWELLPLVLWRLDIKGAAMVRPLNNPRLNRLALALREHEHLEVILRGSDASPRQMLAALKRERALIMAIDVDIETQGVFVDFFGIPAHTPRAPASLALKLGTPVVTYFDRRLADGTHRIRFERVPVTREMRDSADPVLELTRDLVARMEAHIRQYPEQWSWNHRRWKRRPPEEQTPAPGA